VYYSFIYSSPIGQITIASNKDEIVGLWNEGQKYHSFPIEGQMERSPDIPVLKEAAKWLDQYFSKKNPRIYDLPLAPIGTDYRKKVWNVLCKIPYGETVSYGQIAKMLGEDTSPRAVGGAVGHNPISIIIPCHRVVGSNGSLTGYAGGIERKTFLLTLEGCL